MEWIKYSLVYTADSIRKFDSKSNRTADSIRDSIQRKKTIRRSLPQTVTGDGKVRNLDTMSDLSPSHHHSFE